MLNNFTRFIKTKKFEYILLSLMLFLGFAVRLYKIDNPIADWHSWRQADTASVTRTYLESGINLLLPRYHDISSIQTGKLNLNGYRMVEFPFYNAVGAVAVGRIPSISLEVWSRLITIACALVTSLFLYTIGKRLIGKWGGLLSAFFYLFTPFNIYFTRVILPDPMGVMFAVVSLWAFLKFYDAGGAYDKNDSYCDSKDVYLFVSAVFFALGLLIKPYLGFYLVPIAYLAIDKFGFKKIFTDRKILIKAVLFAVVAFAPFFMWRAWESRFAEGIPFYLWAFNGNHIRFKPSFWYWIFGERLGHLLLGSLGLVPFMFGVLNTSVKNFFIHWSLVGMLAYVVVVADANVMHDYYQIMTMPVIAMTLAAGSVYLWNQAFFSKFLTRIILAFSIAVMLITGWNQIVGNYAINHPEILEAGAFLDKIAPKDSLVVAPYDGDTAFLYATKRWGWPAIDNSIDNIISEGADYYVSVNLGSADTKMIMGRFTTIEKNNKFIIIDLNKPLAAKK